MGDRWASALDGKASHIKQTRTILANKPLANKACHRVDISAMSGEIAMRRRAGVLSCLETLGRLRDRIRFPEHALKLVDPAGHILEPHEYLTDHTSVVVDWAAFARRLEEMDLRVASGNCDEICACCGDQRVDVHKRNEGAEAWCTTACRMCYLSLPLCTDCMIYDTRGAAWHCAQCLWSYRVGSNADVDRNPAGDHFQRYVKPSVGHWESLPQSVRAWCQDLNKLSP